MLDFHSHILPGLDDGAPDLNTALEMARIAVADGITEMVATPHYIEGSIENDRELILDHVGEFQKVLRWNNIPLRIWPGCEVYLSPNTPKLIKQGVVMTINDNNKYLLVELPMQSIPNYLEDILFEIKLQGVTPIIAHPERNLAIVDKPELAFDLVANGCFIQINSGSINGFYGKKVKQVANLFVKNSLIHLFGSDAHSAGGRCPRLRKALNHVERFSPRMLDKVAFYGKKLLSGEDVSIEIPSAFYINGIGFWERVKRLLIP